MRTVLHRTWALALLAILGPCLASFDWPGRVEILAQGLESPDPEVRRLTVEALGQLDGSATHAHLIRALRDDEVAVRRAAAVALGAGRVPEAAAPLGTLLTDLDAGMRAAAATALGRIGSPRAVVALVRALGDADGDVRSATVTALGAIGTPEVVLPLLGRLDDAQAAVRELAAQVLGRLGDARAVIPLVGIVQDPVPVNRARAIEALGRLRDRRAAIPLLGALRDAAPEARAEAITALARLGIPEAIESITRALDDPDAAPRLRAVNALGEIGGDAEVPALLRALRVHDLRNAVVEALGRIGARAVPRLATTLRGSSRPDLVGPVVEALGAIDDPAATQVLLEALDRGGAPADALLRALARHGRRVPLLPVLLRIGDTNREVVTAALDALETILDPANPDGRAADPLLGALGSPQPEVRARAAKLLGLLRSRRAAAALGEKARDPDSRVALAAIRALGEIGDPSAAPVLLGRLDAESASERLAAALALDRLASPSTLGPLTARLRAPGAQDRGAILIAIAGPLRRQRNGDAPAAIESLRGLVEAVDLSLGLRAGDALWRARAEEATPLFVHKLASPILDWRRKAADALGGTAPADPRIANAIAALRSTLGADPDAWTRAGAAWSLGSLRASGAAADLRTALEHDEGWGVAANAAASLGRLHDAAAAPGLCRSLGRRDGALRSNAYRALEALAVSAGEAARCGAEEARRAAVSDPSAYVRIAALRYLAAAGERDGVLLGRCADRDPATIVRRTCSELAHPPAASRPAPASGAAAAPVADDTFEFFYVARDGSTTRERSRLYLWLPDRWVRAGASDANGFSRVDRVEPGIVTVEDGDLPLGQEED